MAVRCGEVSRCARLNVEKSRKMNDYFDKLVSQILTLSSF